MIDAPITPVKDVKSSYKLTPAQRGKLYKMRGKGRKLYHFFNDNVFTFGERGRIEARTAYALIMSGHLYCYKRNEYHNIWKAK